MVVQDLEILIQYGIQQSPEKIVRTPGAQASLAVPQAGHDGVEDAGMDFLKSEQHPGSEDGGKVLQLTMRPVFARSHEADGHKQIVIEILDLGQVVGIEDVVLDQGVNVVGLEQSADAFRVMKAGDHDPGGAVAAFKGDAFLCGERVQLADTRCIVVNDTEGDVIHPAFSHMDERARSEGRRAGVVVSGLIAW